MTDYYVPGTEETDPKKTIMSLQQAHEKTATNTTNIATNTTNIATNTTNIATNTTNIAANTAAIAAIAVANKGYFSVNRNGVAGSGTAASYNKIQFTTEDVDSQNWFDNATNYRFTPLEAGRYFVVVGAFSAGNTGGGAETCQAAIYKNASIAVEGVYLSLSTPLNSVASGMIALNGSTDYVEGFVYLPTGVTSYSGATRQLYMFGWKVGT